ncbi:PepSY domain-containing protein [Streptomyces sp. NPDC020403]|uniref:PepSY domain-containing protein n=1 Tax=unclassified Streptomyces TaxID=2593676 RepID=UPI0033EED1D4
MKRNIAIATVTAAVLVGGAIAATTALADDDGGRQDRVSRSTDRTTVSRAADDRVTLERAVAAALEAVPGTVTEAELDDSDGDDGRRVWELDVYGSDKVWHDVTVDAGSGKVVSARDDDGDGRDRHAPRSASVPLRAAAGAALEAAPGTVTSVDLDDDRDDDRGGAPRWEVDVRGEDGREHELRVDASTAVVTTDRHHD